MNQNLSINLNNCIYTFLTLVQKVQIISEAVDVAEW